MPGRLAGKVFVITGVPVSAVSCCGSPIPIARS
jgi:hypothetical protein